MNVSFESDRKIFPYAHKKQSTEFFLKKIKDNMPMSIADFMCLVLTHSQYGYYVKQEAIGHNGDFITAPCISQIFGEIISLFLINFLENIKICDFCLVEFGVGNGILIKQIFKIFNKILKSSKTYDILGFDVNSLLVDFDGKFSVVAQNKILLPNKPCLIVANEFFDAMPAHQFCYTQNGWKEVMIAVNDNCEPFFVLCDPLLSFMPRLYSVGSKEYGSIVEISPSTESIVDYIASHIAKYSGLSIIIDYGYNNPRSISSLHGVYKHKSCNILENIGYADISAHVNFYAIKDLCMKHNVYCYVMTQKDFLCKMHIMERLKTLVSSVDDPIKKSTLENGVHCLISDDAMGVLFKVMIISSDPIDL